MSLDSTRCLSESPLKPGLGFESDEEAEAESSRNRFPGRDFFPDSKILFGYFFWGK